MKVIESTPIIEVLRQYLMQPPPTCACGQPCVRLAFIMGHRFTTQCWDYLRGKT